MVRHVVEEKNGPLDTVRTDLLEEVDELHGVERPRTVLLALNPTSSLLILSISRTVLSFRSSSIARMLCPSGSQFLYLHAATSKYNFVNKNNPPLGFLGEEDLLGDGFLFVSHILFCEPFDLLYRQYRLLLNLGKPVALADIAGSDFDSTTLLCEHRRPFVKSVANLINQSLVAGDCQEAFLGLPYSECMQ